VAYNPKLSFIFLEEQKGVGPGVLLSWAFSAAPVDLDNLD
jgi:hypothetical protein